MAPVLVWAGARLFESLDGGPTGYECVRIAASPAAAHYTYTRKDAG